MRTLPLLLVALLGVRGSVAADHAPGPTSGVAILGGLVRQADGRLEPRTLHLLGARIHAVDQEPAAPGERVVDARGLTLLPAFVDSHVHAALLDPAALPRGGVGAAVDLGAPISVFDAARDAAPLRLLPAGQLLTHRGGYPTRSWGRAGYGREIDGVADARRAVDEMADRGAVAIKTALAGSPLLTPAEQRAIVGRARERQLKVGAHAMLRDTVEAAVASGVDFLVHAPTERLPDDVVTRFARRKGTAVISTLRAFGAPPAARENLQRLRAAGCLVLYGTDVPNNVGPGIDERELALLVELGMTPAEAIDAATAAPARYFGIPGAGCLDPGCDGSVVGVEGRPFEDVRAVARRPLVVIGGRVISAPR